MRRKGEGVGDSVSRLTPLTLPTASAAGPFPLPAGEREIV